MELPSRPCGDILLKPGELTDIRRRLRPLAAQHELTSLIIAAFDHRTRMLPFIVADKRMVPAGPRSIGSTLLDAGFTRTRIVLQQWTPNVLPSQAAIDGREIDLLLLSSMNLHFEKVRELIRDAWTLPPERRPLIVVGGPKVFYEPWDAFSADPDNPAGADLVVTGEEYPLLSMLEVLLSERGRGEPLRQAFARVRDAGLLDVTAGLMYARCGSRGQAEALVHTGPQRLVEDLDEQAHPTPGLGIIEPPGRGRTLAAAPTPAGRIHRRFPLTGLVLTAGCKYNCPYCPIPAYNQRQYRTKSGERIAEEMIRLYREYGLKYHFGADDNFFNDRRRTLEICETLARTEVDGVALRHISRWATEATVHDTLMMKDHLRTVRRSGLRAVWIGVEDMSGALVRKGQSESRTLEAFRVLRERGIIPMPMMMHHDDQPLLTRRDNAGLLNQVNLLAKAGAGSLQVLMITPSPGSKLYEKTYEEGMVYESVAGRDVQPHMHDGNYVIASRHPQPWKKQFNLLASYAMFYNPLRLLRSVANPFARHIPTDLGMQLVGMYGLVHTLRRTLGWAFRLMSNRIRRCTRAPGPSVPVLCPQNPDAAGDEQTALESCDAFPSRG